MRPHYFLLGLVIAVVPLANRAADIAFTVASLKVMPVTGEKAANYQRFETLARDAAAQGANLIVTPEGYLDGYAGGGPKIAPGMTREKLSALAEAIDGPIVSKVAALARELKVHLI